MHRQEIILAYVIVGAILYVAEAALLLSYGLDSDSESNSFQRISEIGSVIGPLVVSWRLAVQMRRPLSDAELLGTAFWCLLAQLIVDIAGIGVASLAGTFDGFDTSWFTPELLRRILFAVLLRYILLYLILWVVLRFPARWLANSRLRHLDVVA